jgi:HTH-type transcriptional regulator / antitoxin HipB
MDIAQIGHAIRTARKARSLSQQALAASLGMSRATISGIETGRIGEIGVRKLAALCATLGLELFVAQTQQRPTLQQLRAEQHAAGKR